MLELKDKGLLLYIIKHCKRVEEKTNEVTIERFYEDDDIKEIICFNVLQIGELVKTLSLELTSKYNKIPWKDIKGMRDRVAHGYGTINLGIVWKTATENIKPLREYCEQIIEENK